MTAKVLKSAICRNGHFGVHHVSVEERTDVNGAVEYVYHNGFSDPLICDYATAVQFFTIRVKDAALDLLREITTARDDASMSVRLDNAKSLLASINE